MTSLIFSSQTQKGSLNLSQFKLMSGELSGIPFVKVILERSSGNLHWIDHKEFQFHSDYMATTLFKIPPSELDQKIDEFNQSVYLDPERKYLLGIVGINSAETKEGEKKFFTLETVEIDNMNEQLILLFYNKLRESLEPKIPLLFKPANHFQERIVTNIPESILPRIYSHEIFKQTRYFVLNAGETKGRLRVFQNIKDFESAQNTIEWFDIIAMDRVPDNIPRVAGLINFEHTTPLSHTNVLASGWKIPNAIQLDKKHTISKLNGLWVKYVVEPHKTEIELQQIEKENVTLDTPLWKLNRIQIESPEVTLTPIVALSELKAVDKYRYGTKAANLGELIHVIKDGSNRMTGFYQVPRPPRANLMGYFKKWVGQTNHFIEKEFLSENVYVPRGIAIPFSLQQMFLETNPRIQQLIGKLKMALELNVPEIDTLCLDLQKLIRISRIPETIINQIDSQLVEHMSGVSTFVVRSSSNAEDLQGFSAAGIYESYNHLQNKEELLQSIKNVWASLLSPRSVRLRQQVGITLDESYMGVIIQEEIKSHYGGVMVTSHPTEVKDFRNVYINVSGSSENVVKGESEAREYLFNSVEGGGRTLSIGEYSEDLPEQIHNRLQLLAVVGKCLQSHFSPNYLFDMPVDIEWLIQNKISHSRENPSKIAIVQIRPFQKN